MLYELSQSTDVEDIVTDSTIGATEDAIQNVQTITSMLHLPTWFGRVLFILLAIIVMLAVVRLVNKAFRRTTDAMILAGNENVTLVSFARYVVLVIIYFIGGVTIISSIPGASSSISALLASGGIVAIIFGLAGQDALKNVAGGIMLLTFKPFCIGDFIRCVDNNVSGTVEDISLRHTAIRTPQNKRIIIPNGKINDSVVENAHYADSRICEFFNIGITYESDMEYAIEVLRQEVERQPLYLDVRDPETEAHLPKVKVEVVELADSAVILRAWLWAADLASVTELKFALNRAIKSRYDAEGIDFAYPHLTIQQ